MRSMLAIRVRSRIFFSKYPPKRNLSSSDKGLADAGSAAGKPTLGIFRLDMASTDQTPWLKFFDLCSRSGLPLAAYLLRLLVMNYNLA